MWTPALVHCWCAAGEVCSTAEDYLVDMGEVHIAGPSPLNQDRTCISGQTCRLDGFRGHFLSDGDAVLLLDTCMDSAHANTTHHMTLPRGASTGFRLSTFHSGASFYWGEVDTAGNANSITFEPNVSAK